VPKPLSSRSSRWGRPLEQLEDRTVPAGNVTAVLSGTTLTIAGDAQGNSVRVIPAGPVGAVAVVGVGTTVNFTGSKSFAGVENINADMRAGNDRLVVQGVSLAASVIRVVLDGNAGDDQIGLDDSTLRASDLVDLQIYGERVTPSAASGTTGNDSITVDRTRVDCGGTIDARLFGETVRGGTVTGGNDTITVADSSFTGGGFSHHLEILGDSNVVLGSGTGRIGGGNDTITVRNTRIAPTNAAGSPQTAADLFIFGDQNIADAAGATVPSGYAVTSIGGGDDVIDVSGCTIAASGGGSGNGAGLWVEGDLTVAVSRASSGVIPAAGIGGGDDTVAVADTSVSATGGASVTDAFVRVVGDEVSAQREAGPAYATLGGGNDVIELRNVSAVTGGPTPGVSSLVVEGDIASGGGFLTLGPSDDAITLDRVQVRGEPLGLQEVQVLGGSGDDTVSVSNASSGRSLAVDLGDGDDVLTFAGNAVPAGGAELAGGSGHDQLFLSGNLGGPLTILDFEEVRVGP
jgi:hypothetical protein